MEVLTKEESGSLSAVVNDALGAGLAVFFEVTSFHPSWFGSGGGGFSAMVTVFSRNFLRGNRTGSVVSGRSVVCGTNFVSAKLFCLELN